MAAKFILKHAAGDKFMFNLLAANQQVILTSQVYQRKAGAQGGIDSVRENAPLDERYERRQAANGTWSFTLSAANQQVIGTSQQYKAKSSMENGIESVKENAPDAEVEDQT